MQGSVDNQKAGSEPDISKVIEQLAHDINGEIFLIRGYTELLQARLQDNPSELALLQKLEARTEALSGVITEYRHRMIAEFVAK